MENGDLDGFGALLISGAAALAWLGGETGKVMVAGGLGALTRWLASERRRLRDGLLAAVAGGITGLYLWPLGLLLPRLVGGAALPETPHNIALSAFVLGAMGTSSVKIITAYLEARADRLTRGNNDADG
jgi:hypothetical protein